MIFHIAALTQFSAVCLQSFKKLYIACDKVQLTSAILRWSDVDLTSMSELKFSWQVLSLQWMIILLKDGKFKYFKRTPGFSFADMVEMSKGEWHPNLLISFWRCSKVLVSSTTKCFCFPLWCIVKGIFRTPILITGELSDNFKVSETGKVCIWTSFCGIAPVNEILSHE